MPVRISLKAASEKNVETLEVEIMDVISSFYGVSAKDVVKSIREAKDAKQIDVIVNSPGGDVFDGIAIFNALKMHPANVKVTVLGLAASAASVIAMAGDEIVMEHASLMMIHNAWMFAGGDADDFEKAAALLRKINDQLVGIYAERTGADEKDIRAMMDEETWLSADEAQAKGFATAIVEQEIAAMAYSGEHKFRNLPEGWQGRLQVAAFADPVQVAAQVANKPKTGEKGMDREKEIRKFCKLAGITDEKKINAYLKSEKTAEQVGEDILAEREAEISAAAPGIAAQNRVTEIGVYCEIAGCSADETLGYVMDAKKSPAAVLAELNVKAKAKREAGDDDGAVQGATRNGGVQITADARDKFRKGASLGILARAGVKLKTPEDQKMAEEFRGHGLFDVAAACLEQMGIKVPRGADKANVFAMALKTKPTFSHHGGSSVFALFTHGTADFPLILADAVNKAFREAYLETRVTYEEWVQKTTFTDFKTRYVTRLSGAPDPEAINEQGELPHKSLGEEGESYTIGTVGEILSFTRKTLINDDMGVFNKITRVFAPAFRRKVQKAVTAILGNGHTSVAMGDGNQLFDNTNHANYVSSSGALTIPNLQAAITKLRKQTGVADGDGVKQIIGVEPVAIIVPAALEFTAYELVNQTMLSSSSEPAGKPNAPVIRGLKVIVDPYLDAYSTTAWYVVADNSTVDTVEVGFLDGQDSPVIESQESFESLGVAFRAYMDFGVKAIDWRGLVKSVA